LFVSGWVYQAPGNQRERCRQPIPAAESPILAAKSKYLFPPLWVDEASWVYVFLICRYFEDATMVTIRGTH
jgi:hypothetical protein